MSTLMALCYRLFRPALEQAWENGADAWHEHYRLCADSVMFGREEPKPPRNPYRKSPGFSVYGNRNQ